MNKLIAGVVVLSAVTVFAQGPLTPPGAPGATMKSLNQIEPRTPITNLPYTISQPGSYYLVGNLTSTGHGIVVSCSHVTIDLMGFTMTGTGSGNGIIANPSSGGYQELVVKNGGIAGFLSGILCNHVEQGALSDLLVTSNSVCGIDFQAFNARAGDNRIERCTIAKNGFGVKMVSYISAVPCDNNRIVDCLVSQNTSDGIHLESLGSGARCDGNVILRSTINQNIGHGVYLSGVFGGSCKGNVIKECQIEGNTQSGIEAPYEGCSRNRVEDNTITANAKGLNIQGSGNFVAGNTVKGNTDNYDFSQDNQLNILLSEIPENIDWPASVKFAGTLGSADTATNGITVSANDVTLDLAGHALIGPGAPSGDGIYQDGQYRNLTVLNGKISNWLEGSLSKSGIAAHGRGNRIHGIQASANYNGIITGPGASLSDCSAHYNTVYGISSGANSTIQGCAASYNNHLGIYAGDGSSLINCSAKDNQAHGIYVVDYCTLSGCAAYQNAGYGIFAQAGCTINDSTAGLNGGIGIHATRGGVIRGCSATFNAQDGIEVVAACKVENCVATHNGSTDDGAGIFVPSYGGENSIDGNHVANNDRGIDVENSGNIIVRNSARDNTENNYDIVAGNSVGTIQTSPVGAGAWDNFAF